MSLGLHLEYTHIHPQQVHTFYVHSRNFLVVSSHVTCSSAEPSRIHITAIKYAVPYKIRSCTEETEFVELKQRSWQMQAVHTVTPIGKYIVNHVCYR